VKKNVGGKKQSNREFRKGDPRDRRIGAGGFVLAMSGREEDYGVN